MFYVYILRSVGHPDQIYIGATTDLKGRFADHNAGKPKHTSNTRLGQSSTTLRFNTKT